MSIARCTSSAASGQAFPLLLNEQLSDLVFPIGKARSRLPEGSTALRTGRGRPLVLRVGRRFDRLGGVRRTGLLVARYRLVGSRGVVNCERLSRLRGDPLPIDVVVIGLCHTPTLTIDTYYSYGSSDRATLLPPSAGGLPSPPSRVAQYTFGGSRERRAMSVADYFESVNHWDWERLEPEALRIAMISLGW